MALDFDGTDDKVDHGDINAIDGSAVLTVCFWTNIDTLADQDEFWSKWTPNSGIVMRLTGTSGAIRHFFDNSAAFADSTAILSTARWTHLAVVYDGNLANANRFTLYLNGVSSALTVTGTIATSIPSTTVSFATMGGGPGGFLDGRMGNLKVWTAALTASEVRQEMWSYRPVRRTNLILWAPYDDRTTQIQVRDYSGSGNHGTVTGALVTGGPPQIPRPERPLVLRKRRTHSGLWGHRILA